MLNCKPMFLFFFIKVDRMLAIYFTSQYSFRDRLKERIFEYLKIQFPD